MRFKRRKTTYIPSMDAMERRELLSGATLTAIPGRGFHAIVSEFERHHLAPLAAHGQKAVPPSPRGHAGGLKAGAKAGAVTLRQQADIAAAFLQLVDPVLQRLSNLDPGAEAAAGHVRQLIAQLTSLSQSQPASLVSAPQDDPLEFLLNTLGPGDPFASKGIVSQASLKPGDIIARCTAGLGSQALELAHWSRYSHVAIYIGHGQIIDAMPDGVHTRSLDSMLADSNRAAVLRVPGLTAAQAQNVIRAAKAREGAAYNFTALAALETQKVAAVLSHAHEGLGGIIGVLSRAERLPAFLVDNGTFACSQLVRYAFRKAGITLTHANGVTPGDIVRLGMVGVLDEVGRLEVPAQQATSTTGAWLP